MSILPKSFYTRTDVVKVSKELLGKLLVSRINGVLTAGTIVETEAYRAPDDKACHAYQNKRTSRTEVMFHEGGCAYVYICYGIHHLFNVVSGEKDMAHVILIRGIEPIKGVEHMMERRGLNQLKPALTAGPGSLSKALGIKKELSGVSLLDRKSKIWIEDQGLNIDKNEIVAGPRVGMSTAEECSHWPWRFRIKGNKWSSKPNTVKYDF